MHICKKTYQFTTAGRNHLCKFWAHPRTPPHRPRRKNLLRKPNYSQFCPKFRCHGNGGRSRKMRLAAFDGPSPKTPYRRKNHAKISYASQVIANFVPNFVAMATGVSRGKCNWQHSMAHPLSNPPIGAKISQKSPTQAEL